jgi:signal transduction histidine kinase
LWLTGWGDRDRRDLTARGETASFSPTIRRAQATSYDHEMIVSVVWREAGRVRATDALPVFGLLGLTEGFGATIGGTSPIPLMVGAVAIAPLIWRRRAPVTVWAVSSAATLAATMSHYVPGLIAMPAPLLALYTVAAHRERLVSLMAGFLTLLGLAGMVAVDGLSLVVGLHGTRSAGAQDPGPGSIAGWVGFLLPAAVVAGCWLVGDNVRVSRAYLAELRAKAVRAESDRAAHQAKAAAEERNRIARELHDVVVHHVSVIAIQAGAARMLAGNGVTQADAGRAWSDVETTARRALTELRQLLGVLRHDRERPALAPPPGLDQLDRLIDEVRLAGLPVESRVEGHPVALASAVGLSAYRIVQEALTNVLKHQGAAPTNVFVRYQAERLELEVVSRPADGPPPPLPPGRGHGLVGMRERVTVLGGELDARPRPDGGFAIIAHIPIPIPNGA